MATAAMFAGPHEEAGAYDWFLPPRGVREGLDPNVLVPGKLIDLLRCREGQTSLPRVS